MGRGIKMTQQQSEAEKAAGQYQSKMRGSCMFDTIETQFASRDFLAGAKWMLEQAEKRKPKAGGADRNTAIRFAGYSRCIEDLKQLLQPK